MKRMWINQPSTLQPFNNRHGENVLAENETFDNSQYGKSTVVWTLSGDLQCFIIPMAALSYGWREEKEQPPECQHKRQLIRHYPAVATHPDGPAFAGEHWDTVCEECGHIGMAWYSPLGAPPGWNRDDKHVRECVYDSAANTVVYKEIN